jgi:6-phosphogluconolactonase (cycloisomerase 2 family)
MRGKIGQLALAGVSLVCAIALAACSNGSASVQNIAVSPTSGTIFLGAGSDSGVKAANHRAGNTASRGAATAARRGVTSSTTHSASHPAQRNGVRANDSSAAGAVCGAIQYSATVFFTDGTQQDGTSTVGWTSSNQTAATIASGGLATGLASGTTNITASAFGITSAVSPLTVDLLTAITVTPPNPTVPLGTSDEPSTQAFTATATYTTPDGNAANTVDITGLVDWETDDPTVATIDETGLATTVGGGSTNVSAAFCGVSGSTLLTVSGSGPMTLKIIPANPTISTGTTTVFTAVELNGDGSTQPPTGAISWNSGTTATATIGAANGIAQGLAVGTTTITATEAGTGFSGTTVLTVAAAAARFAYVANLSGGTGEGSISSYSVDPVAGTLTSLGAGYTSQGPQQVILHPSGKYLYAIDSLSQSSLRLYDVDSTTGAISLDTTHIPVQGGEGNTNVGIIDPTGRFLYVIDDAGDTVFGFQISTTDGSLTPIAGMAPYTTNLDSPQSIQTDRSGKYLYIINNGSSNDVSEYSIDQTSGALTPLATPTIPTGNFPYYSTTDVNGHLYVANNGTVQSVSGYSIDSGTGQLTSVGADTTVTGATSTINVITDPTGKYLYVLDSNLATGQVFAYNVNTSSGVIGSQIGTAQATGASPTGMAIDPTGALLAVDNNIDNTISLFQVGATGALTPSTPATVPTEATPQFVVFYTAAAGQ